MTAVDGDGRAPMAPIMTRRQLLRRSAIVGGVLVWTAPAVQAVMPAADAAGPGSGPTHVKGAKHVHPPQPGSQGSPPGQLASTGLPIAPALEIGAGLAAVGAVLAKVRKNRSGEEST